MDRAKEIYLNYSGNHFYMDHDGVGSEYATYNVSRETEEQWRREFIQDFFQTNKSGKEALRSYFIVVEFFRGRKQDEGWERCLYYPLRAEYLDDVTVLFMLGGSFRLAEAAVRKSAFSKAEAEAYLQVLDDFIQKIQDGNITRSQDYDRQEFSDPEYISEYLSDLKKKWLDLFR